MEGRMEERDASAKKFFWKEKWMKAVIFQFIDPIHGMKGAESLPVNPDTHLLLTLGLRNL